MRLPVLGALAVVGLAAVVATGTIPRLRRENDAYAAARETAAARPRVTVAVARRAAPQAERVLPGNSLPLLEAGLFPRATGYIKSRLVDIGDRVEKGQLLAVIDSPDIDDQLAQARANLEQARANLAKAKADVAYATSEEHRYRQLLPSRAASPEEYEGKYRTLGAATAVVGEMEAASKVNEAAVQQFTDLQGFEKIFAPFPGVITARNIDPGDLVSANSTSRELFHLMRTDTLRVFANVPQVFATGITVGQNAVVYLREDPQTTYTGKVTRTADALDASTRTLLTEVQVPNPDNTLRPGMYLQVKFIFERGAAPVLIPAAALATRSDGPRVAVLDSQHQVHYRAVQLGRDYGAEIEVTAGVNAGDTIVVHPGDDIPEGTAVEPVPPPR
jgi:RND family efflux transporter MFP subunit